MLVEVVLSSVLIVSAGPARSESHKAKPEQVASNTKPTGLRDDTWVTQLKNMIQDPTANTSTRRKVQALVRIAEIEGPEITLFLKTMQARWEDAYRNQRTLALQDYRHLSLTVDRILRARPDLSEEDLARVASANSKGAKN